MAKSNIEIGEGGFVLNILWTVAVYTVPDTGSQDIKFDQSANIYTLSTFSLISCCKIL